MGWSFLLGRGTRLFYLRCAKPLREMRVSLKEVLEAETKREDVSNAETRRHVLRFAAQA